VRRPALFAFQSGLASTAILASTRGILARLFEECSFLLTTPGLNEDHRLGEITEYGAIGTNVPRQRLAHKGEARAPGKLL
jgi:hypothetical protein